MIRIRLFRANSARYLDERNFLIAVEEPIPKVLRVNCIGSACVLLYFKLLAELLCQSGYHLRQIAHNTVIRELKNGRVGIRVDSYDDF